jgi:hypothetical protein
MTITSCVPSRLENSRTFHYKFLKLGFFVSLPFLAGHCGSGAKASSEVPAATAALFSYGDAIQGATLSGPLAGKAFYLLGGGVNHSNCWQDSEYWDGTTLWFALTSTSWTKLAAQSIKAADPGCALPTEQNGGGFNIYSAVPSAGTWTITHPSFNSFTNGTLDLAAPKLSGSLLAAVIYEKTNAKGNIYFVTKTGADSWTAPVAFSQNTTACNDDNPVVFANGSKMIFESDRLTASTGSSCTGHQKLWFSQLVGGTWSTPVALTGGPTLGAAATQPWLDESAGQLYWTADNANADVCPTNTANCVVEADGTGTSWSSTLKMILSPSPFLNSASSDGKLLLVGQFTMANGYAVASCGIATYSAATDPALLGNHLALHFSGCVIPLK